MAIFCKPRCFIFQGQPIIFAFLDFALHGLTNLVKFGI